MKKIYLIGSLRNPKIPEISAQLRELGYDVFDDWFAAGPEADDYWKKYEQERGRTYAEAMEGFAANHVYNFDKHHLDTSDIVVLVLPAGKSGHLELGYAIGSGKEGHILLEPIDDETKRDRWDVMYLFAKKVHHTMDSLLSALNSTATKKLRVVDAP